MVFKDDSPLYATELERRQGEEVLYINFMSAPFIPSISEDPSIMGKVVDALSENPEIAKIVFVQQETTIIHLIRYLILLKLREFIIILLSKKRC